MSWDKDGFSLEPECGVKTEPDSFGKYIICEKPASHDGPHHGWLIGNVELKDFTWYSPKEASDG